MNTELKIDGNVINDAKTIRLNKAISENNGASSFGISFDNPFGRHSDEFSLNEDVIINYETGQQKEEQVLLSVDSSQVLIGNDWLAQTFTIGTVGVDEDMYVYGVSFRAYAYSGSTGIKVAIRATSGGKPTGPDLISKTLTRDELNANPDGISKMVHFGDSVLLEAGTKYAIVWGCASGELDVSLTFSPSYPGSQTCTSGNAGVSWGSLSNWGCGFKIFAYKRLFDGVIEDIRFSGEGIKQKLELSGRDYSAIMQDILIEPTSYRDQEVSTIVQNIMDVNVAGITTNNVNVTPTTIDRITFNHLNVFDAIKQLAEIAGYYFYVDKDKDLHFEQKESIDSGVTLNNENILEGRMVTEDRDIYNSVWVYGKRILTGYQDDFIADGIGSAFTLTDQPHNTKVQVNGSSIQPGGIEGMDNPAYTDIKYLIDYDQKKLIFTSGLAAGDNIPTGSVIVNYDRGTPILKYREDATSIANYGTKTKLIVDKNIQSFEEANQKAETFISENKDPIIEGNLSVNGIYNVEPGQYVTVDIPDYGVSSEQYTLVDISYYFTPQTTEQEDVIKVRLNKKIDKFEDTIKEIILNQKASDTSDLQGYLTNFQQKTGSIAVDSHYELWTTNGSTFPFEFHVPGNDVFNSPNCVLGPWLLGSQLLISGGDF